MGYWNGRSAVIPLIFFFFFCTVFSGRLGVFRSGHGVAVCLLTGTIKIMIR